MSRPDPRETLRARRPPPPFRPVEVRRHRRRGPRLVAVTLAGHALDGFAIDHPAASVRVLLPSAADKGLVVPAWNGNEFLLADGRRPGIRTFTPRRFDPQRRELDIEIVIHAGGLASDWAQAVVPGAPAAVSGPGRGYEVDPTCGTYLLGGDETAIPAISQLLEVIPAGASIEVGIETAHGDAQVELPDHPGAHVTWCQPLGGEPARSDRSADTAGQPAGPDRWNNTAENVRQPEPADRSEPRLPGDERGVVADRTDVAIGQALLAWIRGTELAADTRVWVAGEAAAVQRIRRHLFEERRLPRSQATVRGYWKYGRSGEPGDDRS